MKLPKQTIWKQNNFSDLYGDIWCSWGIDLSDEYGKLKTTRTLSVARSVDDGTNNYVSGLGLAVAFRFYGDQYFAATHGTISKTGTSRAGAWALDATASKPTTVSNRYSDMEIFNENLYVSLSGTGVSKYNGSAWSTVSPTGLQSSRPHMMCVYAERLYITADYAKIQSIDTSDASAGTIGTDSYTLDLIRPTENTITFMRAVSDGIWIGTVNRTGGKGHMYKWDGQKTSVSQAYELESTGAMACVIKDDVPYIMDNDGRLLTFNGGTFLELDRLPLATGEYLFFALGEYNERWIHPNGMTVKENSILISIDNEYRGSAASWEENVPSGIWEWTKETGLYHKYSLSMTNHDATVLRDYGQNHIAIAGALYYIKSTSTSATDNGSLLASAQLFYDASNTENHIFIDDLNDTVQKNGYFVTSKIFSSTFDDIWQKVLTRFKKLSTGDEIVLKYRTEDEDPLNIDITTWSGSGSVRTSTTITGYGVGDEIEFLQGEGAGKCFKITSTSDLGGGVTEITLNGSFPGLSGGSGKARLQHWKQIGDSFVDISKESIEKTIGANTSGWIQLKVCIQNTGDSYIYDMLIVSKLNQKI